MATTTYNPLEQELGLVGQFRNLAGQSSTADLAQARSGTRSDLIPLQTQDQLALMMTQFARNNGLQEALSMPKQAGMYKSSGSRLATSNILAAAASQAALSNAKIQEGNAGIQRANATIPQGADSTEMRKRRQQDAMLAAIIAGATGKNPFGGLGTALSNGYENLFGNSDITNGGQFTDAPIIGNAATDTAAISDIPLDSSVYDIFGETGDLSAASEVGDAAELSEADWASIFS